MTVEINFIEDKIVTLAPYINCLINAKINKFVSDLSVKGQSVNYYKEKRNTNFEKAAKDIFLGKKAEAMTLNYLVQELNFPSIKLDLDIRIGPTKGWTPDLPFNKVDFNFPNVHVKACQSWTLEWVKDYSWTFQVSNNFGFGGKDDIFKKPSSDLIAFVFMDTPESSQSTIKAIVPCKAIFPWGKTKSLFKDPKKENLKNLKQCIYYKDLLTLR